MEASDVEEDARRGGGDGRPRRGRRGGRRGARSCCVRRTFAFLRVLLALARRLRGGGSYQEHQSEQEETGLHVDVAENN